MSSVIYNSVYLSLLLPTLSSKRLPEPRRPPKWRRKSLQDSIIHRGEKNKFGETVENVISEQLCEHALVLVISLDKRNTRHRDRTNFCAKVILFLKTVLQQSTLLPKMNSNNADWPRMRFKPERPQNWTSKSLQP